MLHQLATLLDLSQDALLVAFAVFLRVSGAQIGFPAFGHEAVPQRVRLVIAFAFTLIVFPMVSQNFSHAFSDDRQVVRVLAGELVIGLVFGLVMRLFVLALQTAGTIAAQAISLSQLFGGTAGEPQPVVGHLFTTGALAFAVMMDLHVHLAQAIIQSYDFLPAGAIPQAEDVKEWGLVSIAKTFSLAFVLAAPFLIASVVYNVALGAINKAMPQLMVAMVGAPAITAGGLILLMLCVPTGIVIWHQRLISFLANPLGAW
ncbi:flagellar biosynthetic protein FliR [Albirhodobacter sp. R86504]|uniref:flagellar biosynthetic protein FliR n=1 Tax=Albirhodobacter sp. R86504 TaxID=3093848 RepID=UPI0036723BA8